MGNIVNNNAIAKTNKQKITLKLCASASRYFIALCEGKVNAMKDQFNFSREEGVIYYKLHGFSCFKINEIILP